MQLKALDLINLCYIWLNSYPALRRTWSGRCEKSKNAFRVNYGFDTVPAPDELVFGGLVKLQDLNKEFSHSKTSPDILYLVSSALPYFPVRMAHFAHKAGAKLVVNQNGVAYPGWYGTGWERANTSMKRLLHMADYVVYQSCFCKKSADRFLGQPKKLCHEILYNPVDTTAFCPPFDPVKFDDRIILLLAGSHWTSSRVTSAVETLRKIRQYNRHVHLRIAGRFCWQDSQDDAQQEILAYARKLGVAEYIEMTGAYAQQQAPGLLNQCSILLHTKYNDPCPRLVVEAMACGLPVVYSATGGVSELVGEDAGIGVPGPLDWDEDHPPDASALAVGVEEVIENLEHYSRAARSRAVQKFDVEPWLRRHEEIFKRLLQ